MDLSTRSITPLLNLKYVLRGAGLEKGLLMADIVCLSLFRALIDITPGECSVILHGLTEICIIEKKSSYILLDPSKHING